MKEDTKLHNPINNQARGCRLNTCIPLLLAIFKCYYSYLYTQDTLARKVGLMFNSIIFYLHYGTQIIFGIASSKWGIAPDELLHRAIYQPLCKAPFHANG